MQIPREVPPLLREAAEWRLLGLLFEYPSPEWRRNLESLLPALPDEELRALGEAALECFTEGMHFALFGPAGSVPVREVTYRGGVQFGYLMAEHAAFYEAFGYAPRIVEPADHLAVQLGFLAFLRIKQAHSLLNAEPAPAALAAEAAALFLKEHVAVQAEPALRRLENYAPDFLIDAGQRLLRHAGPAPRSAFPLVGAFHQDADDESPQCGSTPAPDQLVPLQP